MVRDPGILDFDLYILWTCDLFSSYLTSSNLKKCCFGLLDETVTLLSAISLTESSNQDLLWLVICIWNESTTSWDVKDVDESKKWSEMALRLAQYCQACPQINQIHERYTEQLI